MKHQRKDYDDRVQDAAELIPKDEPVFLLRGQDQFSAACVRLWANLVENAGGDPDLVQSVRDHARAMDEWPEKKIPDLPGQVT